MLFALVLTSEKRRFNVRTESSFEEFIPSLIGEKSVGITLSPLNALSLVQGVVILLKEKWN